MAIARSAALAYLTNQYATLATLVGQATTDTANGYGQAIDDALLSLGTAYTDLATADVVDAKALDYRALLRYHALRHFEQKLAAKISFALVEATGSVTPRESVQLAQVRALLAEARGEVFALGYSVGGGASGIQSVRYNPDVPFRDSGLLA